MKIIAHRGLLNGPDSNLENLPGQILLSLQAGYDCEVDVRLIDGKWMLGHDTPDFEVPFEFLKQTGLWIHAKNLEALDYLSTTGLNYFWHQNDDYVITSKGYIWAYPGKPLTTRSVMVLPEWEDNTLQNVIEVNCVGICSDYPAQIRQLLGQPVQQEQTMLDF
jgi:hypothetical protein